MRVLTLIAGLFVTTLTYAQDTITLRTGEQVSAKVLEIAKEELKYRKAANPDGPIYTAPVRDVLLINYANGTKDVFDAGRTAPAEVNPRDRMNPSFAPRQRGISRRADQPAAPGWLRYQRRLFNHQFVDVNGQRVDMAQTEALLRFRPDAILAFDRGRSLRTWSLITGGSAVALIGAGAGLALADRWDHNAGRFDGRPSRMGPFDPGTGPTWQNDRRGHDQAMLGAALAGGGVVLGLTSIWLGHRATVQFRRAANRYNMAPSTSFRLAPASQGLGLGLSMNL